MKRIIFICMAIVMLLGTTAFGAQEENVIQINEGTSRDEVHKIIGEAESVSVEGYREVYTLENGKSAVMYYRDDMFDFGFIVVGR